MERLSTVLVLGLLVAGCAQGEPSPRPSPAVDRRLHGLDIEPGQGRVDLGPDNPAVPYPDGSARLAVEVRAGARAHVGRGPGDRPEIRVVLDGASGSVRVWNGRLVAEVGARGRISVEGGTSFHTVPVALIVEVAAPGAKLFPHTVKGAWHVVTFLTKNELSDLDSRYWLGGEGAGTDRIQFAAEEYRQLGVDFEALKAARLVPAGKSGDGKDVLLIPPAAAAVRALFQKAPGAQFSDRRSGFRSYEDQESSWRNNIKEPYGEYHRKSGLLVHMGAKVAVPGYSQHGTGGAVDFTADRGEDPKFRAIALDHGFVRSEIRAQWRKGGFVAGWVDRPHFLYIGHDLAPVPYFPSPEAAK